MLCVGFVYFHASSSSTTPELSFSSFSICCVFASLIDFVLPRKSASWTCRSGWNLTFRRLDSLGLAVSGMAPLRENLSHKRLSLTQGGVLLPTGRKFKEGPFQRTSPGSGSGQYTLIPEF